MTYRLTFGRYTRVNGLLGAGHFLSHFYQLCLPPLFIAWQKVFDVSFAELGVAMAVLSVVAAVMQTPMGFIVDRYGARPLLIARHSDDEPGDFGHGGCDLLLANCRAGAVVGRRQFGVSSLRLRDPVGLGRARAARALVRIPYLHRQSRLGGGAARDSRPDAAARLARRAHRARTGRHSGGYSGPVAEPHPH